MLNSLPWHLGWRFFRARQTNPSIRIISLASTLGIALGVAVLLVVLSVMNGFEHELLHKYLNLTSHAQIRASQGHLKQWRSIVATAQANSGVVAAAPEVQVQALVQQEQNYAGINLYGIDVQAEAKVSDLQQFMSDSAWQSLSSAEPNVVLGQGLAKKLELEVGMPLLLYLPSSAGMNEPPKLQRFEITGIFTTHGQIDYQRAYVSRAAASKILGQPDAVTQVKLKVRDLFEAPMIVRQIGYQLNQAVYLSDWTHKDLFRDIQLVRIILYVVLFLVIAVACFNVVSTLVMSVREKQSEIAILLTMGLSTRSIQAVFVAQGCLNGFLGVILGSFFGVLLALNLTSIVQSIEAVLGIDLLAGDIYFIDYVPVLIDGFECFVVTLMAWLMSVTATLYPAYKASRVQPAQALSYQV
jgi:lipoprotein-releasing system permease protein